MATTTLFSEVNRTEKARQNLIKAINDYRELRDGKYVQVLATIPDETKISKICGLIELINMLQTEGQGEDIVTEDEGDQLEIFR